MHPLLLRAALKRGFLLVAANWRVVLIDFAVESFQKTALMVPVLGGVLMVGALVGDDVSEVLARGAVAAAETVLGALVSTPFALAAFLAALTLVMIGGQAVALVVKGGTLGVLVKADRIAGEAHRGPIGVDSLTRAMAFDAADVIASARRFARRMATLAAVLGLIYLVLVLAYLAVARLGLMPAEAAEWLPAWSLLMVFSTSAGVVVLAAVHLVFDLVRVAIVTDDCGIREAVGRVRRFVIEDARQVIGIFSVISGIEILAAATSILAAAGLTPIAYVPVLGLIVLPLQVAVWLVRGLVFEWLSLASLSAYQTQYRRFARARWPGNPPGADYRVDDGAGAAGGGDAAGAVGT
jgi:hypothetical protein